MLLIIEGDMIFWTSVIVGYVEAGEILETQALFEAMSVKDLVSQNEIISGYGLW